MTFKDIFTVVYAIPTGVQLGQDFVKRPQNVGAGQWMAFWESVFESDPDELQSSYDEIRDLTNKVEGLESDLEDSAREVSDSMKTVFALEKENDDLRDAILDLELENTELLRKIDRLEEDAAEANYALGQKFGDRV